MNIIFDRVGKVDPVTKGFEIAVHWMGFNTDIRFWSQHVSFLLIGAITVTSIRGLLLTLTKVRKSIVSQEEKMPFKINDTKIDVRGVYIFSHAK